MRSKLTQALLGLALLTVVLTGCGAQGAQNSSTTTSQGTPAKGGVLTTTYGVNLQPVYIFPLFPGADSDVQTTFGFIDQFWLPLYWSGNGAQVANNSSLSLAEQPVMSNGNRTATITLKPWKWSDGKPITTRDVEFFINEFKAEKANYGWYTAGSFPDDVKSIDYKSSRTFSITFKHPYNKTYLVMNELSIIFAIPQHAWDKTSKNGRIGNYDLTTAGAKAVYAYLNSNSESVNTFASNPLWQVVDGPFKLSGYVPNSEVDMAPNRAYSGPDKPHLDKIRFLNFTSDAAEYNQLLSGSLDYGYVPINDIPSESQVRSRGYSVVPWNVAGQNYAIYNYTNPVTGPLFSQLYIRQAIQEVTDQPEMVKSALQGQGIVDYGPVPKYKPAPTADGVSLVQPSSQNDTYPFNPTAAANLLKSHGWTVKTGGIDRCTDPGTGANQCGAGIKSGQELRFQVKYPASNEPYSLEMQILQTDASRAGISVQLQPVPLASTYDFTLCSRGKATTACDWDVDYYFPGGWVYGIPLGYPVGPQIFGCGAQFAGGYCSSTLDKIIQEGVTQQGVSGLYKYEVFLNKNLPALWLPLQPYQVSAIKNTVGGLTPQNEGVLIMPQFWYLKK